MTQTTNSFNEAASNYAQKQQEEWEKKNKKLSRIKKGLIIAAVAQGIWVLAYLFSKANFVTVSDIFCYFGLAGNVAAYIVGGGIVSVLKRAWGMAKKLFFLGWVSVPFPIDIFTGLFTSVFAFALLPMAIIFLPLLLVFLNYRDIKKEINSISTD